MHVKEFKLWFNLKVLFEYIRSLCALQNLLARRLLEWIEVRKETFKWLRPFQKPSATYVFYFCKNGRTYILAWRCPSLLYRMPFEASQNFKQG